MNTALAQQIANEGGVGAWMIAQQHKSLLAFFDSVVASMTAKVP